MATDDAVHASTVHHDIDGIAEVAISESFDCDPVFRDFLTGMQTPNS